MFSSRWGHALRGKWNIDGIVLTSSELFLEKAAVAFGSPPASSVGLLPLVIICQAMAFSQFVALLWAAAWCHGKLKPDPPPHWSVVFASPGCRVSLAPCLAVAIHLLEADDPLFQLPKVRPQPLWVPLWQVASTFGVKTGPTPKKSWSSFLQQLVKNRVFGNPKLKFLVALSFSFLSTITTVLVN